MSGDCCVQEKLLPTVTTGWKLWIPAHAINFGFVPPSQRVLYVNVIAVSPICGHSSSSSLPSACLPLVNGLLM